MNNFNVFFDKIYVISGKRSIERRRYVAQILKNLNIDFNFFDAVMGNDLSDKEIDAVYDEELAKNEKTCNRALSKPEIGTVLSHLEIYKKILKLNFENTLIFEDDIKPVNKNFVNIKEALDELPMDWDLIHFGTLNHDARAPLSYKLKLLFYFPFAKVLLPNRIDYKYRHLWNFYPKKYSKSLKKAGYQLGTQAYAISRKGAEKVLDYHHKIVSPVDTMLSGMIVENKLNAFLTKKIIFEQNREFKSLIDEARKRKWNVRN